MASRGSVAKNGHTTTSEYTTIFISDSGVKVLTGIGKIHSLPDLAHTPNSIYAKLYPDGTLKEMRFYGPDCFPVLEIAYHPEPKINDNSRERITHFHSYDGLKRSSANRITEHLKKKYEVYLKEFDLYDKC